LEFNYYYFTALILSLETDLLMAREKIYYWKNSVYMNTNMANSKEEHIQGRVENLLKDN
jgi:hypothetical protein